VSSPPPTVFLLSQPHATSTTALTPNPNPNPTPHPRRLRHQAGHPGRWARHHQRRSAGARQPPRQERADCGIRVR